MIPRLHNRNNKPRNFGSIRWEVYRRLCFRIFYLIEAFSGKNLVYMESAEFRDQLYNVDNSGRRVGFFPKRPSDGFLMLDGSSALYY